MKFISGLLVLATVVAIVRSLEEDPTKEKKCFPPPDSDIVGLNQTWFKEQETFFVPLWNQLYATRMAADMIGRDAKYISFFEVQPSSCLQMQKSGTIFGFGRTVKFNIKMNDDNSITLRSPRPDALYGKFYFHLTDNKHYVLGVTCWRSDKDDSENEASWAVLSNQPFLEEKARKDIIKHIKAQGFDERKAVDENYALCPNHIFVTPVIRPVVPVIPTFYRRPVLFYPGWKK